MAELPVAGVRIGHWSDVSALTGCTVLFLPPGVVASGEVRGGAPATRETDLLDPSRLVEAVDAVVLTGGSAYGLAAADGVMADLEAMGRGYDTVARKVPIVVALGLYDLRVGQPIAPGPAEGRAALADALADLPVAEGSVGAGVGATVDKWRGLEHARPGGIGIVTKADGDLVVTAVIAVNAYGGLDPGGSEIPPPVAPSTTYGTNTTIGVVVTNAVLSKHGCHRVAVSGHDGMARALRPVHTAGDGDALVVAATGQVEAASERVRWLAEDAVRDAIVRAVSLGGTTA